MCSIVSPRLLSGLEGYVHVLRVAQLLQVGETGILDHGGRPTHEDLGVLSGRGQVGGDHVSVDETRTVLPI